MPRPHAVLTHLCAVVARGLALAPQDRDAPGYTDTPLLPGGKWRVHDSGRLRPAGVQSFGCGKAPSDELFGGRIAVSFIVGIVSDYIPL